MHPASQNSLLWMLVAGGHLQPPEVEVIFGPFFKSLSYDVMTFILSQILSQMRSYYILLLDLIPGSKRK